MKWEFGEIRIEKGLRFTYARYNIFMDLTRNELTSTTLKYSAFERLKIQRPVNRIQFLVDAVKNKIVLDLGCYDETAIHSKSQELWLHGILCKHAASVIGIDNSNLLPEEGLVTSKTSKINKGEVINVQVPDEIDVVVAGELIEHLPNTFSFMANLKKESEGKTITLFLSTPNASAFHNFFLSLFSMESQHQDHLQIYSYKTLSTLCRRNGIKKWEIIPYFASFPEIILRTPSYLRWMPKLFERVVNAVEFIFPMTSAGFILKVSFLK